MENIKYKIEFYSNWHCGSGLSAGADVDSLVIKDTDGLPFIPGRTLKGLLRDAATQLYGENDKIKNMFGVSDDEKEPDFSGCFFKDAKLSENERDYIIQNNLSDYLYQTFASTAIENGIAKPASLRKIETVVPCVLEGEILDIPDEEHIKILNKAMMFIKRIGTGRNRGYGRCDIRKE